MKSRHNLETSRLEKKCGHIIKRKMETKKATKNHEHQQKKSWPIIQKNLVTTNISKNHMNIIKGINSRRADLTRTQAASKHLTSLVCTFSSTLVKRGTSRSKGK
jgi:hypothetical protein